jgi:DNA methylase
MEKQNAIGRLDHLTFKGNHKQTRYGWLRLTPAYSVHLVTELINDQVSNSSIVLDPFCGTGTTALVCAERESHVIRQTLTRFSCGSHGLKQIFISYKTLTPLRISPRRLKDQYGLQTIRLNGFLPCIRSKSGGTKAH